MATISYMKTGVLDNGAISQLGKLLQRQGGARPFIVTDAGIRAAGVLDKVIENLGVEPVDIFDETLANPEEAQAEIAAERYKQGKADSIIAVGGGSSLDMAKMVGIMVTHEGPWSRYGVAERGGKHIKPIPPFIAIPTTSGTGSEVSAGAMITMRAGFKELFFADNLLPDIALCDPELTIGLPAGLTAATGMDAVTHCVESILSPNANPVADAIALDGLERAVGWGMLKRAVAEGSDKDARYNMMLASYEGAMAFVKGLGSVHALSHAAGRLTDLRPHHGTLNAIWLPHVLRFNADAPGMDAAYARIRRAMGLADNADLADEIAKLNADIGLPEGLKSLGFTSEHGDGVVDYALKDLATRTNPKAPDRSDYERLYDVALG